MDPKYIPTKNESTCPVCRSRKLKQFFDLHDVPVNVCIQWPTQQEALQCPKGDTKLAFCLSCGFIWNTVFDKDLLNYSEAYENSLFYSALYQEYTDTLVRRLLKRYNLHNKDVMDIGCGKGDFLFLLSRLGNNRGIGFDTSFESSNYNCQVPEGAKIIEDFYSEKYAEYKSDFICSRYVLEHVENPKVFLRMIRSSIDDHKSVVYFEVPNVSLILCDLSVWDIIYEHCSYFSLNSLEHVFALCGFDVLDSYESYNRQFLGIEAVPGNGQSKPHRISVNNLEEITKAVSSFVENNRRQLEFWRDNLEDIEARKERVILWGAGAKGVSFLNMLNIKDQIRYVADINSRKHGKYIAGTAQQIVPPEFLKSYKPDTIIITNPIYKKEIQKTTVELGINAKLI